MTRDSSKRDVLVRMVSGGAALLCVTLASGCSMFSEAPPARTVAPKAQVAKAEKLLPLEGSGAKVVESPRHVGDVAVRRYSGSFRDAPITVTEEVVAQEGKLVVVDYAIEQGDEKQILRVRYDASDRAVRVSHLEGEKELPGTLSELDDLMAEVSFAPDMNDGKLSSKNETCLVGPRELDCELTKYKVYVGDQKATLAVSRSSELGQDVAGEVVAVDGTVIYRAELLDTKSGAGQSTASAKLDK